MASGVASIDDFVKKYGTDTAELLIQKLVAFTLLEGNEYDCAVATETAAMAKDLTAALRACVSK